MSERKRQRGGKRESERDKLGVSGVAEQNGQRRWRENGASEREGKRG